MKSKSLSIKNLNCQSCTSKLPDIPNTTFKTSLILQKILVSFDQKKISLSEIKQRLRKNGFVIGAKQTHFRIFFLSTLNLLLAHIFDCHKQSTNSRVFAFFNYTVIFFIYWLCIYKISKTGQVLSILGSLLAFVDFCCSGTNLKVSLFILWYLILGKVILDLIYKINTKSFDTANTYDVVDDFLKYKQTDSSNMFFKVKINEIKPGDIIKIVPGQTIPVDGYLISIINNKNDDQMKILTGGALKQENATSPEDLQQNFSQGHKSIFVDESTLTGESKLALKNIGYLLHAGTKNQDYTFLMKTQKTKKNTLQGQIISLLQKNTFKSTTNDVYMQTFNKVLLIFCFFTFIIHFLLYINNCQPDFIVDGFPFLIAFKVVANIVIIACPCALNLSKPLVGFIISRELRKHGIILSDIECLTKKIDMAIFDKTGTLTDGFIVKKLIFYGFDAENTSSQRDQSVEDVQKKGISVTKESMKCAESLGMLVYFLKVLQEIQKNNNHSIAKAIHEHCNFLLEETKCNIAAKRRSFEYKSGFGIYGCIEVLQNAKNCVIDYVITKVKDTHVVKFNGSTVAEIIITESIKEGAMDLVTYFLDQKISVAICTGDTQKAAENVASQLGIQECYFEQSTKMKYDLIKEMQKTCTVMMIGDGINDLPALKRADIGISLSTIHDETSVSVLKNDMESISLFWSSVNSAEKRIRLCYNVSLIYNVVCVSVASGLFLPFGIYVDTRKSCMLMFWSSLFVVGNSLWFYKARILNK